MEVKSKNSVAWEIVSVEADMCRIYILEEDSKANRATSVVFQIEQRHVLHWAFRNVSTRF